MAKFLAVLLLAAFACITFGFKTEDGDITNEYSPDTKVVDMPMDKSMDAEDDLEEPGQFDNDESFEDELEDPNEDDIEEPVQFETDEDLDFADEEEDPNNDDLEDMNGPESEDSLDLRDNREESDGSLMDAKDDEVSADGLNRRCHRHRHWHRHCRHWRRHYRHRHRHYRHWRRHYRHRRRHYRRWRRHHRRHHHRRYSLRCKSGTWVGGRIKPGHPIYKTIRFRPYFRRTPAIVTGVQKLGSYHYSTVRFGVRVVAKTRTYMRIKLYTWGKHSGVHQLYVNWMACPR